MNISKQDIDALNAVVTIEIGPSDYEHRVDSAIKKAQQKASIPGFRPGKVPAGMVKKMYGKSVLVDELNKILNDSIYNYINDSKLEVLGNPLPKDTETIDWDNGTNFTFKYELGLAPQFEVEVSDKTAFTYEVVKVDEDLINKYVKDVRRNYGKPSNPEVAGEKDVLFVDANELDANGEIKAGGVFKSLSIGIERVKNPSAQKKLIGAKKDDKIVIHCKELYDNTLDFSIAFTIEKELADSLDCNLQLTVKNIARMDDADLNEELFNKIYGEGTVKTEEEFRAKIKDELATMFAQDSDRKFFQEVEKTLVDTINPKLPEDFLKRWLVSANDKPVTLEQVSAEFDAWARQMKWKLIENKIIKNNDLKVTQEEATEEAKRFVRSQYARYGQTPTDEEVDKLTATVLGKEKEVEKIYENIFYTKILGLFKSKYKLNNKEVSYNEFFGIKE